MATGVVGTVLFLVLSHLHGVSTKDVTVHGFVGHGITLPCDSSDTGTQITWFQDGDIIASRFGTSIDNKDKNVEFVSSTSGGMLNSLRLKSVTMSRNGTYQCKLITNMGSIITTVKLVVHESPKIILPNVLVDGSDEASVACQTPKDVDLAGMSWKLSNGTTMKQINYLNKTTKAFLKPTRKMHGQTLTCFAEFYHGVGKVEQSVVLDVKYLTLTIVDSGGPHREGQQSVNLTCKAEGNPMATSYTWTTPNTSRLWEKTKAGMTIVFEDAISSNETGSYRCSATNGFVNASSPHYHLVLEPDGGSMDELIIYLGCLAGGALMLLIVVVVFVCRHKRPTNPYLDERDSTPIHKPAPPRRLPNPGDDGNLEVGVVYSGPLPKPHPHGRSPRPQQRNPLAFSYLEAHNGDADNISSTKTDPEDYDDVEVR